VWPQLDRPGTELFYACCGYCHSFSHRMNPGLSQAAEEFCLGEKQQVCVRTGKETAAPSTTLRPDSILEGHGFSRAALIS
jgi:hypothetical protein